MASNNTIKVVARFRPTNKIEAVNGGQTVVAFDSDDTCNIQARDGAGNFTFDRVFDMNSKQTDVFEFSIRPTVDDIINGYNGTVFAYGQTGSGKSYTMMGPDIDDERSKGIIPRIVEQIFASIMASPGNIEYTVRVSYMEIYMERIRDLLAPQNDNLPIHEEKARGVYVKGLLEIYVSSIGEVYEVMRRGGLARATAATNMNQESSRSHSIFVVTVAQKNVESGSAKSGQLFLVDLAGSEKVGKTGASGQTLEEAKKINKSLSALGMVINSLTDGKSTHIPYRDSKLTRILQESLGGNSRTTLIVNCSPSSFNAEETISTLRFGVRAKKIQNKAKINAELSPAELKALLKKAQAQVTTFQDYIASLEGEVSLWRNGERVPRERWTPARSQSNAPTKRLDTRQLPATPSRMGSYDSRRTDTPSRSESRLELDRSSTPSIILDKDERDEFLRRENELQDQLADKDSQITTAEMELQQARAELETLKMQQNHMSGDNERLQSDVGDLKVRVERLQFESREASITMDQFKESNAELTAELDDVKQQLLDAKIMASQSIAAQDEKDRKKSERMAEMMAGFKVDGIEMGEERAEMMLRRREALEERLAAVEKDYEELLERNLSEADIEEVKLRLGDAYMNRQSSENDIMDDLRDEVARTNESNQKLRRELEMIQQQPKPGATAGSVAAIGGINGKTLQQQLADFDVMKKSLMRDLQNRCERVVELEISLDETREQYNNVLRTSNNRAQQKKMAFLERNLEQLTHVQRQLVEQNSSLKKEVAIAERKLIARNERIQSLEALLHESQDNLLLTSQRFDAQITAFQERLEAHRAAAANRVISSTSDAGGLGFSLSGVGSRIAKPLRGGGEISSNGNMSVNNPSPAGLQVQDKEGASNKKAGWLRSWPGGGTSRT